MMSKVKQIFVTARQESRYDSAKEADSGHLVLLSLAEALAGTLRPLAHVAGDLRPFNFGYCRAVSLLR
jgi:hypothetical protein